MTNLDRAKELIEALDNRRDRRIETGEPGHWPTELNEVARILHYLIAHLEPELDRSHLTDDVLNDF